MSHMSCQPRSIGMIISLLILASLSRITLGRCTSPSVSTPTTKILSPLDQRRGQWGLAHIGGDFLGGTTTFGMDARICGIHSMMSLRGGASLGEDEEEVYDDSEADEYDTEDLSETDVTEDEEEEESNDDSYDEEESEEEQEEAEGDTDISPSAASPDSVDVLYDKPLVPDPFQQISMTVGIMVLCNKVDVFDPKFVRIARAAFVAYVIIMQIFLGYVRIRAKSINDRTPITLNNPLSSLVQSQLPQSGGGANDMVKNLANQFLSSQSTIMEYDLNQAKAMNSSLLFPMIFLWFLHFKMGQVQPLLFQTATGIMNLFYSPLFQVYVLGRNLERPFKKENPMAQRMEALKKQQEEMAKGKVEEASKYGSGDGEIDESGDDNEAEDVEDDSMDGQEDYETASEYDDYDYDSDASEGDE